MSVEFIRDEIDDFLRACEPEVLCISGRWGVGKTYVWETQYRKLKGQNEIGLERYSYVSLFGKNSLNEIRMEIFQSFEMTGKKENEPAHKKWLALGNLTIAQARKIKPYLPKFLRNYAESLALTDNLLFASVRSQLVCLDDLERLGDGISVNDIVGLISDLKYQKGCSVALILNQHELDGKNEKDFNAQIEKVIDRLIVFQPSSEESADIALDKEFSFHDDLKRNCAVLNINNIRVLRRIERTAIRLAEALNGLDMRVTAKAIHSAALYRFAIDQPTVAPSIDFIEQFNNLAHVMEKDNEEKNPDWVELLKRYNYSHTDEFDLEILAGIRSGVFDGEKLRVLAGQIQDTLFLSDSENSMRKAWDYFRGSFKDNADEVLDCLAVAFEENLTLHDANSLQEIVTIFKRLGREGQARNLIGLFVQNRDEPREFWEVRKHWRGNRIQDIDVINAFRAKLDSFPKPKKDPKEILLKIYRESGWNPDDIEALSALTVEDFEALFKTLEGDVLEAVAIEAIRFNRRGADGSVEKLIGERALSALESIGGETEINVIRVESILRLA